MCKCDGDALSNVMVWKSKCSSHAFSSWTSAWQLKSSTQMFHEMGTRQWTAGRSRLRRADARLIPQRANNVTATRLNFTVARTEVYGFLYSMTVSSWTVNDIGVNCVPTLIPGHSHWATTPVSHIWLVEKRMGRENLLPCLILKTQLFDLYQNVWWPVVSVAMTCSQILHFLASPLMTSSVPNHQRWCYKVLCAAELLRTTTTAAAGQETWT